MTQSTPSSPPAEPVTRYGKGRYLVLGALVLVAGALYLGSHFLYPEEAKALTSMPIIQGEFLISLKLKGGELEAIKSEQIISPQVRGQLKITKLWPEGEKVEVGNLVVQFDPTEFGKRVTETEQALEGSKASLETTKANQGVEISRQESDIENQKAQLRLSQLQVEKMKFEASIQKETSKLEARKAELSLEQAYKRFEAQKVVNAAELRKTELEVAQKERELEQAKKDLANLDVHAEKPGIVVYEKVWKAGRMEKIRVGDEPWGGQKLITLPDLSRMQVKTFVNEVDVDKLKVGQRTVINLDALPEFTFHGSITNIATLGHEKEGEKNVKVFDVTLAIDEEDARLKPGMTAACDVIIETIPPPAPEIPGAVKNETALETSPAGLPLYIPLDAVFEKDGKTLVYRLEKGKAQPREVKLGKKNENYVIVEEGLSAEDRITLRDPTLATGQPGGQEAGQQPQEQGVKIK
ncbi:MAG: HlyD family efflux transporter periplasmic adaptor subunit [Candidatus Latescibacteria bacterium]|nr:HlyD family efflux transporter periplasmic adaptor subunit [Candidatus Latescibacterota bacterium]